MRIRYRAAHCKIGGGVCTDTESGRDTMDGVHLQRRFAEAAAHHECRYLVYGVGTEILRCIPPKLCADTERYRADVATACGAPGTAPSWALLHLVVLEGGPAWR